jgi:hypothetical protein
MNAGHLTVRMKAAPTSMRIAWAALFALMLAARSLAPAGFMPAFAQVGVTIVACPDAPGAPPMHPHGEHKQFHQPCPYAAASALGALASDWMSLLAVVLFTALLLASPPPARFVAHAVRERPPSRGPPLPA